MSNKNLIFNESMDQFDRPTIQQQQQHNNKKINLVQEILYEQDLSRAGNLFTLNNDMLLNDFPVTIEILKSIVDNKNYIYNLNQQSIVEIVLTKCISALRDTKMISCYYDDLLDLLELCLKYNLNNTCLDSRENKSFRNSIISDYLNQNDTSTIDTTLTCLNISNSSPHANIVSDILSCILLDYLDPNLCIKTIPICIKLLQHTNCKKELLREITSYLNLIACRSPELLVDYVYHIVNAMLKTNQSGLSSLLYQICESNTECIYPLVKYLVKGLKLIESTNDLVNILQIMYLVSLNHVQLIVVHLEDLIAYLHDDVCQEVVLDIMYSIANQSPISLDDYLPLFEQTWYFIDSNKVDKILSCVGKSLRKKSEYCTNLLIERIKRLMEKRTKASMTNKRLSYCLNEKAIRSYILNDEANKKSLPNESYVNKSYSYSYSTSTSSSKNKNSNKKKANDLNASNEYYSNNEQHEHELSILSQNKSKLILDYEKRFVQILVEIYEIAQVFPNILNTYLKKILNLFKKPITEEVSIMIERFKQLKSENSSICSKEDFLNDYELNIEDEQEDLLDKDFVYLNEKKDNEELLDKENYEIYQNNESFEEDVDGEEDDNDDNDDDDDNDKYLNKTKSKATSLDDEQKEIEELIRKFDEEFNFSDDENESINCNLQNDEEIKTEARKADLIKKLNELENFNENDEQVLDEVVTTYEINTSIRIERILEEAEEEDNINMNEIQKHETCLISSKINKQPDFNTNLTLKSFKDGLDNQINQSEHPISSTIRIQNDDVNQEKYRGDVVQRFFIKHNEKIKNYILNLRKLLPIPVDIELDDENSACSNTNSLKRSTINRSTLNRSNGLNDFLLKKFKSTKRNSILKFKCESKCETNCLFSKNYFESSTSFSSIWIHLLILSIQAESDYPLNQQSESYLHLKSIYEKLNEKDSFLVLVTSSFPTEKQLNDLKNELAESRLFDLFEYKHDELGMNWNCYLCSNPDKQSDLNDEKPLIQGQLKEKHGKWKFLRRWHKRIFTLTGGSIVYFKKDMRQESLNVRYIKEIQTLKSTSSKTKSKKQVPKAFEIFTDTNSFILKAQNSTDAEKWIQYLQISKAIENNRMLNDSGSF